ncbi:hypothetical protein AB8E26_00765 [Stenotrophomonas rhizophila]|uniref:hypothetical protein n=1 Tax=Stenotrophomonas rhizophila TaxID=216778 RepID=UPI003512D948
MPPRSPSFALAGLLALCAAASSATARPATGGSAGLRIGVRIVADCSRPGTPGEPACRPAQQRSDGRQPVPAQVTALSPTIEAARPGQPALVTVTY